MSQARIVMYVHLLMAMATMSIEMALMLVEVMIRTMGDAWWRMEHEGCMIHDP